MVANSGQLANNENKGRYALWKVCVDLPIPCSSVHHNTETANFLRTIYSGVRHRNEYGYIIMVIYHT